MPRQRLQFGSKKVTTIYTMIQCLERQLHCHNLIKSIIPYSIHFQFYFSHMGFFSKGIMLHRLCNKHLLNRFRHHRYRYWEKWKWCQQNRDWYTCILVCRRYCCYYHHKIVFSKTKAYLVKGNQFIPQGEIIFQLTFQKKISGELFRPNFAWTIYCVCDCEIRNKFITDL